LILSGTTCAFVHTAKIRRIEKNEQVACRSIRAYIGTSEQANGKHESECMANGSILVFLTMRSPPPLPIIRLPPNTLVNLQDRIHYESFPANARLRCSRTCIENPNRPQKTAQSFLHCDTQNEYSLAFTRKLDMMLELCYYGCEIRRQA